jgi:uncharacterized repeat protein (TIGR02059 family)
MHRGKKADIKTAFNFFVVTALTIQMLVFIEPMVPVANAAAGTETSGLCSSAVGEMDRATIAQVGNDCVLTFFATSQTTSSNSNSWTVPSGVREASMLVVAGGGGGGVRHGGGGGAGGLVYLENVGVNAGGTPIAINVGGGGIGSDSTAANRAGSNSTVTLSSAAVNSTVITAVGGSGGGHNISGTTPGGGSSGGGSGTNGSSAATQGNQNYGFGNTGAAGTGSGDQSTFTGGGGGGAGGVGVAGVIGTPGRGGLGKVISITGSDVCYAAGGGGGGFGNSATTLSNGGYCTVGQLVGGSGSLRGNGVTRAAVDNTGSGGGGGGFNDGTNAVAGAGTAGVVIIRWTIPGNTGAFPDVSGLSARFNASNFNTTLNGGLGTWADTSGSGYHIASTNITGTAMTMGTSGSNANGSSKSFNVVNGVPTSRMTMMSTANMTGKYTLITVARYSGASRTRIFQGLTGNYLHGFWQNGIGIFHNDGWRTGTSSPSDLSTNTNWLMSSECTYDASPAANSCTSSYSAQGMQRSTSMNTVTTAYGLAVNAGAHQAESSDFQIADVLVFNRVLTIPQVNDIEKYLSDKYGINIYSDLVANYDPADNGTTKTVLKNLSKGSGFIADNLDLTLYGGALKSSSNGGSINLDREDSSYGQTVSSMRPMSKFSGEIWVKPRADQGSYDYTSLITTQYWSAGQHLYPTILMTGVNNNMRVEGGFYSGSQWRTSSGVASNPPGFQMVADTWYHLATTYDGTNVRFYVNGVQQGNTVATTDVLLRNDAYLRIGTRWDGGESTFGFNGLIGKVRVYEHGRSGSEVLSNYNADKSRYECSSTTTNPNGDTKVTFTTAGSCSWQAPVGVTKVNALLVGGGGGGGAWVGGGGGGGGVLELTGQNAITVTPGTTYPITVGGGGGGSYFSSAAVQARGSNGGNTSALGSIAYGGGRGAMWDRIATGGPGVATGGGAALSSGTGSVGIPSISPAQGFSGGTTVQDWTYGYQTGGGGGAGGAGGNGATSGNPRASGNGGAGKASTITGTLYGGGGGGGCHGNGNTGTCSNGSGVNGGGNGAGNGGLFVNAAALFKGGDGTDNLGGGGGGSGAPSVNSYSVHSQGGTGGSGIVVLQYQVGPTITGVTSSSTNGNFALGSTVSIQVSFSEAVTVITSGGTPTLTVETGATDRAVNYASGSGSSSLTFTYTVQAGDLSSDLDYASTTALALNGGTIRDSVANNAVLTLAAPGATGSLGANKAIVVDGVVPTYVSSAVNAAGTKVILTYSEALNATTAATGDFTVTVAGSAAIISSVVVSGSTVELTMTSRISTGQVVTFTYTDPSVSNDANAVQDSFGNDAATRSSTSVINNSTVTVLGSPTGLSASATAVKTIAVTWNAVANASSYTVILYDSTGATVRATKTGVTTPTSYTFTTSDFSFVDGTIHQVSVTAIGNASTYFDSAESSKVSVTTSTALATPLSVAAVPTGTAPTGTLKSIALTWAAVTNASSYTVKIYDVATGGTAVATINSISSSATSTTITTSQFAGMADKTTYYISVTAVGNGSTYITSAESSRATVTTHAVASAISISTQPASQQKTVGQSVTFTVTASATDQGTLSYVWKKGATTVGTNSSSYTFTTTSTSDAGNFTVTVTNTLNGSTPTTLTSSTATLTMSSALTFNSRSNVTITAGTALSGSSLISVTANNGRENRSYGVTAGALPAGLTLDSSTGVIGGTATVAGTFSGIKITVTDANGATLEMASPFSITVNSGTQLPISILTRFGTGGQALTLAIQGGSGTGALTYTLDPLVQPSCLLSGFILTPNFPVGTSGTCFVKATKAADDAFTATSSAATTIFFTAYVPVITQTTTCPAGTVPSAPTGIGVGSCIQVLAPVSPTAGDSGAAPKITSLSATSGLVGASITITGTGFSTVTRVQFGTQSTTTFTATSTTITVAVPTGATRGRVIVFSPTGSAMAAQIFTVIVIDTQAPGFTGGSVNTSTPTQLTLNFDETIDGTGVLATSFAVSVAGTNRAITGISISGTTITLTLASAVSAGQTVDFTYTSPNSSASIKDAAGNKTATITLRGLTNNLT